MGIRYISFLFAVFFCCNAAWAGTAFNATVAALIPTDSYFSFYGVGTRSGTPSCSSGSPTQWTVDTSTSADLAISATLITAFSMGKTVDIYGTGTCNVATGMETVGIL